MTQTDSEIKCCHCSDPICGTRVICMQCGSRRTFDFCDKPECIASTIKTGDDLSSAHLPTHDIVKIRSPILHDREIGKVLREAKAGLERAKNLLLEVVNQKRLKTEEKLRGKVRMVEAGDGKDKDERVSMKLAPAIREAISSDSKSQDEVDMPRCLRCRKPVSLPCMYCIDCPGALSAL